MPTTAERLQRKKTKIFNDSITRYGSITCEYCKKQNLRRGARFSDCNTTPDLATVDHIIPKSKGGTWAYDNILVSCFECNQKKNNGKL